MKKLFSFICLTISLFILTNTSFSQENSAQPKPEIKVIFKFKVSGLNSQKDADIIDKDLIKYNYIIKSQTDFKTGIAEVAAASEDNKEKIAEAICANWRVIGNKINTELVDIIKRGSIN